MTSRFRMAVLLGLVCCGCHAQTPMDVQPVKQLNRSANLATCDYNPTPKEMPFYRKLNAEEQVTGSGQQEYSLQGKQGRYVSWFGIVRGVLDSRSGATTLLVEQKAFDGMTDCHIMLVAFAGAGDFHAIFNGGRDTVAPLSLIRVYGKVTGVKNGVPEVSAEYVRVWPWMTFTFTEEGPANKGNPAWTKLCTLCKPGGRIYNPFPDRNYYLSTLGDPQAFASTAAASTPANQTASQPPAGGARGLVRYEVKDPPLFLFKPENWTVTPGHTATQLRVRVAEPGGATRVDAIFTDNHTARLNSLKLLATFAQQMKQKDPDLQLSETMACKDQAISCAVTTITFTDGGVPMRGRYFFHADANQAVIRGYLAPTAEFNAKRPLLLDVLTNIHLLSSGGEQAAAAKPPLNVQFTQRSAPDDSWQLNLPSDWNATGAQGKVLAGDPNGAGGFLFTSFQIFPPGYMRGIRLPPQAIVAPYQSPQQAIGVIWQKFNNRQIRILASTPDPQTAAYCTAQLRKRCEAADVQLTWVSPKGEACTGSFKVLNGLPSITGDWFSILAGIWGPSDDMDRYLPVLDHVARSFSINDRYAQEYIQEGMQHLRALQAQTQHAINGLYQAIDDNQRDAEQRSATHERSVYAFGDAMLGNSYWISDVEGGKVYATDPWGTTDTGTGKRREGEPYDYINFEGQNPNYPSETMHEVNSYDVMHMQQ